MFHFLVLFHFSFSDTWLFTFLPLLLRDICESHYTFMAREFQCDGSWPGQPEHFSMTHVLRVFITSVSSICLGIANIFKHIFKEMRKYCFV